jgi:hypothetical protein
MALNIPHSHSRSIPQESRHLTLAQSVTPPGDYPLNRASFPYAPICIKYVLSTIRFLLWAFGASCGGSIFNQDQSIL